MSWLNTLLNINKTKTIQVELFDETEKSIKVKYGVSTTYLPKILITFDRVYKGNKLKVKLPTRLYWKSFI
jgi:hypothetical protein